MRLVWIVIPMILIGIVGTQNVDGLWFAKSPQELLVQSHTIIVGNVTDKKILEIPQTTEISGSFDKENIPYKGPFSARVIEQFGDSKIFEITYVSHIDELTINIEEYLQNFSSFENTTMNVRSPTISGGPVLHHEVKSKFELGDRVLLYFTQQSLTNLTYDIESFVIPEQCDSTDVLTQERFWMNESIFHVIQNGTEQSNDDHKLVTNIPITLSIGKDAGTLFGKSFDVDIKITKQVGNDPPEIVFTKVVKAKAEPCEWIAYADLEFTPKDGGKYVIIGNNLDKKFSSSTKWIVKHVFVDFDKILSPFKQYAMDIPVDEIQCRESLIVMEKYDGSPACVKPATAEKLIQRGWASP